MQLGLAPPANRVRHALLVAKVRLPSQDQRHLDVGRRHAPDHGELVAVGSGDGHRSLRGLGHRGRYPTTVGPSRSKEIVLTSGGGGAVLDLNPGDPDLFASARPPAAPGAMLLS